MSEPTTHPDFLNIVNAVKQKNIKIKICTNGDLHTDDFWNTLGLLLTSTDEVWFTICGSTQSIHAHYRVNTNLEKILHHAQIIRNHQKIDCVKCIRFQYNYKDLESDEFKNMISQFSYVEFLDTSFPEDKKIYENDFNYDDFIPIQTTLSEYKKINNMSDLYFKLTNKNINCQSIFDRQLQIDPYGNIFPCYRFMENNSNILNWNYKQINDGLYDCCKFCNSKIVQYCYKNGKNFII